MKTSLSLSVLALALGLAQPVAAQRFGCGSLTFEFAREGSDTGCNTAGSGLAVLVAYAAPASGRADEACSAWFTVAAADPLKWADPVLIVGEEDPQQDLSRLGFPGCVLRATPRVFLPLKPMGAVYVSPIIEVSLPPDPALLGQTVYAQALFVSEAKAGIMLSNGLSATIHGK